jgi:hypothetical protein
MIVYDPVSGLKYFCKTTKIDDEFDRYFGSGVKWRRMTKRRQDKLVKLWVSDFFHDTSIVKFAMRFSRFNRIVESNEWANLKPENGLDGGSDSSFYTDKVREKISKGRIKYLKENGNPHLGMKRSDETKRRIGEKSKGRKACLGRPRPEETKRKIGNANRGKTRSLEVRQKMSETRKGKSWGSHSEEARQRMSETRKGKPQRVLQCPHCGKTGGVSNIKRYHMENCNERR